MHNIVPGILDVQLQQTTLLLIKVVRDFNNTVMSISNIKHSCRKQIHQVICSEMQTYLLVSIQENLSK